MELVPTMSYPAASKLSGSKVKKRNKTHPRLGVQIGMSNLLRVGRKKIGPPCIFHEISPNT